MLAADRKKERKLKIQIIAAMIALGVLMFIIIHLVRSMFKDKKEDPQPSIVLSVQIKEKTGENGDNKVEMKVTNSNNTSLVRISDFARWTGERLDTPKFLEKTYHIDSVALVKDFLNTEKKNYAAYLRKENNPLSLVVYNTFFRTPYIVYLLVKSKDHAKYLKERGILEENNGVLEMVKSKEGDELIFNWLLEKYSQTQVIDPLVSIVETISEKATKERREMKKAVSVLVSILATTPPYVIEKKNIAIGGRKLENVLSKLKEIADWLTPDRDLTEKIAKEKNEVVKQELETMLKSKQAIRNSALPEKVTFEEQKLQYITKEIIDVFFGVTVTNSRYFSTLLEMCKDVKSEFGTNTGSEEEITYRDIFFEVPIKYFHFSTKKGYNQYLEHLRESISTKMGESVDKAGDAFNLAKEVIAQLSLLSDINMYAMGLVVCEMDVLLKENGGDRHIYGLMKEWYMEMSLKFVEDANFEVELPVLLKNLFDKNLTNRDITKILEESKAQSQDQAQDSDSTNKGWLGLFHSAPDPADAFRKSLDDLALTKAGMKDFRPLLCSILHYHGEVLMELTTWMHTAQDAEDMQKEITVEKDL